MLTPAELTRLCVPRGTTSIVADPHEIANVCGVDGISYMLEASEGLPINAYFMLPSCVPATPHDESGAVLYAKELEPFYKEKRVLGLAEMMNFPGVLMDAPDVVEKIRRARDNGKVVDGHAPLLTGKALDKYISAQIGSDHECSRLDEAKEKISKGQWVMIRQGTAARNLYDLMGLFETPYDRRCFLATDDRHPADLANEGHIDNIIRLAVKYGASAVRAIRMASLQAAEYFGIRYVGAIAPGYRADVVVLSDLDEVKVENVYVRGEKVVSDGKMKSFDAPAVSDALKERVYNSFNVDVLTPSDFHIEERAERCRVIGVIAGQLVTEEKIEKIKWEKNNGVDLERDILKLAVIERHNNTGHRGLGFIEGIGMKRGAIASSVSHDSHNLIVIGTNDEDMAIAANTVREFGGNAVVVDGKVVSSMSLPVAGLMADCSGEEIARANAEVREAVHTLGVPKEIEPFMNMAFVSLSVIPFVKMTTEGLVDVNQQKKISLYVD